VKHVKGIKVGELSFHEFRRLLRKKYFSKRYYDGKAKEFYEMKMGSMIGEDYMKTLQYLTKLNKI